MEVHTQLARTEAPSQDPARPASIIQPHTRLSATLGIATVSTGLGLLVALRFDDDQHLSERLLGMAVLGALLGLAYIATQLRLRCSIRDIRKGYRLGRKVERAVTRRRI